MVYNNICMLLPSMIKIIKSKNILYLDIIMKLFETEDNGIQHHLYGIDNQ